MNRYYLVAKNIDIKLNHTTKEFLFTDNSLSDGMEVMMDLGDHHVGYVSLEIENLGHHQDAPLYFQINFYEHISETNMDIDSYNGWVSKSWVQEERIHVDVLPTKLELKRRYSFRYVKIKVLSVSSNYKVVFKKLIVDTVTSANWKNVDRYKGSPLDEKIYNVSLKTLYECNQLVFEDGPKRDQRLWLGDLRLEALTNYISFKNNDLVKKCLYLFAGSVNSNGLISSNVFTEPTFEGDYQSMIDYSLLFIPTLYEYYINTLDKETLIDLYDIAKSQADLFLNFYLKNDYFSFIDWNLKLDKEAATLGVYLYTLKFLMEIENILNKDTSGTLNKINEYKKYAYNKFYDSNLELFISGKDKQISYATNIWMILGDVVDSNTAKNVLNKLENNKNVIMMVSPYLYHYYIEALIKVGLKDKAHETIHYYWGKMLEESADTFYEVFNPLNLNESPYGGKIVHSFCHAWSCTPAYFLKKYF